MAKYDGVTINIKNWDEYNPKRDQKTYTWLRLDNGIATDPKLFGLTAIQKFGWITMLCEASKRNDGRCFINYEWFERIVGLKEKDLDDLIGFLIDTTIVDTDATARGRELSPTLQNTTPTNERTNERTNEHDREIVLDFDKLYLKYPRKMGKQEGLKRCRSQIKTLEDYGLLSSAVDKYRKHVLAQAVDDRFIKHFSTFMSGWKDWIDPEAGKSLVNQPVIPIRIKQDFLTEQKTNLTSEEIRKIIDSEMEVNRFSIK